MIYLDTSVALAQLLAEDRVPPIELWEESLVASRLLEYEMWTRLHARGLARSHGELTRQLLARIALLDLSPSVLARALEPFAMPVRTLDALHLASMEFLCKRGLAVQLASYDGRLVESARSLGIQIREL